MNPLIQTQFAFADPNASPLTINELIALLNTLVSSQIIPENTYIPYVIGHDNPSTEDQDKAWIQLDSSGNPIALNIFVNGNWRRIYNGMLGEIRGFSGDPGYNTTGNFDHTGLGNMPGGSGGSQGTYDGWAICNGANGSINLSNQFILGADMANASGHGYSSGWQSNILINTVLTQKKTGGLFETLLTPNNVPLPSPNDPVAPVKMDRYDATGETNNSGGNLYGINSVQHTNVVPPYPPAGYVGNSAPIPVPTTPPFFSLAWIQFIGY